MSEMPLFGLLIIERAPFDFGDFPGLLQAWLQDAGGFAMVGLLIYMLYALTQPQDQSESTKYRAGVNVWMLAMTVLAIICYVGFALFFFSNRGVDTLNVQAIPDTPSAYVKYEPPKFSTQLQPLALMLGGLFAMLGFGQPFVSSLARIRFSRFYALAKLSFKEAIRNRYLWAFAVFLIPFLFPLNWFFQTKAEDELRLSVEISSGLMSILVLFVSALIGSFAIPNDIKNQNIYTIVSKPVQRFEIVIGRFLGYMALMTAALLVMATISWVFIYFNKVDEKAKDETFKARVPIRGTMEYRSQRGQIKGVDVGNEFNYRKYIAGSEKTSSRAVWSFNDLPANLGDGASQSYIPCEFEFDIYKMTKGEENRGVFVNMRICSWQCGQTAPTPEQKGQAYWNWSDPNKKAAYDQRATELIKALPQATTTFQQENPGLILGTARPPEPGQEPTPEWLAVNTLAREFGFYELTSREIYDYTPERIGVPTGLFENANEPRPESQSPDQPLPPEVKVYVKCLTAGQLLGVAEGDLYILEGEKSFVENFFKAIFGLWCRVCIVLGLSIVLSTYLTGIVTFLGTLFLYGSAFFTDHIKDLASSNSYVGGPARAMSQLLNAEQSTVQLDARNPITRLAEGFDNIYSWVIRRIINLVPDVEAFSWTSYISEGFNIPFEALVMNLVLTVGYLLPWFVLGFYLLRSREVAA